MSLKYIVKAFEMKVGSAARKLVLLKLADNCNDLGECWPSYQHIADQCEMDRRTVMRHIKALESDGFLRITRRKGEKGNSSNVFNLTLGGDPMSLGGDRVSPPPGDRVSPRTSHSIESFIESSEKIPGLDVKAWSDWLSFKKQIKDMYKTERGMASKAKALVELSKSTGISQAELVKNSIDEEWKGIYAPRTNGFDSMKPQQQRQLPRAFGQ